MGEPIVQCHNLKAGPYAAGRDIVRPVVVLRGFGWCGLRCESGGNTAALHIGGVMRFGATVVLIMAGTGAVRAQQGTPLLGEKDVAALANELSGETAKRNLEGLARLHRQRGSTGFHAAAELVAERARAYGLSDVAILQFPADGKIFYGTQRSRPGWDAEAGQMWEVGAVAASCWEAAYTKPDGGE